MTHRVKPHSETAPERLWPAWLFSLVFHSSAIVVLGFVVQATPRRPEGLGHSMGIVLNANRAADEAAEQDESGDDVPAVAVIQPQPAGLQPAELLSAEPSEPPPIVVESEPPAPLRPQTSTPTPRAIASTGGHQPNPALQNSDSGTGRGTAGGHGDARVSVFGVQGQGKKFLYLFDRSSSMDGAPLAAAKRQLLESLVPLESVHQFHIMFFNTRTQAFEVAGGGRRIAYATDRNKQLAAKFVGGITADGGTDRITALKQAISFAPDVIFFLTDAEDPLQRLELEEIAQANRRARSAICTIEFGRRQSPSPGSFLAELARQSGGQYGYVNTATLGP